MIRQVLALLLVSGAAVRGQIPDSVVLKLHVTDSLGKPISGANVALRLRNGKIVDADTTIQTGDLSLTLLHAPAGLQFQLAVRRLGFAPFTKELAFDSVQTLSLDVVLATATVSLDTTRIIAREAIRQQVYHVDAMAIAQSDRPIFDGWDVLLKLRPDIAYGRGSCPGVQELWVNGVWFPPQTGILNQLVAAREPQPSTATPHLNHRVTRDTARLIAISTLASIRPQDIEEMTYRDCHDLPVGTEPPSALQHSTSALFVILKSGVQFDPARGSYVGKPPSR